MEIFSCIQSGIILFEDRPYWVEDIYQNPGKQVLNKHTQDIRTNKTTWRSSKIIKGN